MKTTANEDDRQLFLRINPEIGTGAAPYILADCACDYSDACVRPNHKAEAEPIAIFENRVSGAGPDS